jgi:hypothetical protein
MSSPKKVRQNSKLPRRNLELARAKRALRKHLPELRER